MAKDDKPDAGSKGISRTQAETLVSRYFGCKEKIEKINADAKKKAEGARADMGVVIDDAERLGIKRSAFKATLKRIDMARKAEAARANLEADERDSLDHLEEMIEANIASWGDTPLGKAMAMGKANTGKTTEDKVAGIAKAAGASTAPVTH